MSAEGSDSPPTASTTDTQVSAEGSDSPPTANTTDTQVSAEGSEDVRSVTQKQSHTIKQLLDAKISGKVFNVCWIHFVDGGGQSEFLELLPALVSNVTVTIYVIDLSMKPDEHCNDFFTIKNLPQGTRKTSLTGKELFERFLKTICSQKDDKKCKVMFVGTHYDNAAERESNLKEWNGLIQVLWNEYIADEVEIIKTTQNSIVHAINANSPGDNEQKALMRKQLTECCIEKNVAIAEFLIEEDLKSSPLAQKKENNGILTYSECQKITKQYATENTLKKALQYFHELSEYFYFPGEQLVFTKPHILVQIISKLIKVANYCRSSPGSGIALKFWKFGLISDKDLNEILKYKDLPGEENTEGNATNKYYRPGVFEGKQLLMVLQNLSIAAHYARSPGYCARLLAYCARSPAYCARSPAYFIPCVLPPCTKPNDMNEDTRNFMMKNPPLLLIFKKDKGGKISSIPRGLFCGLVTYLIDKCTVAWEFRPVKTQNYRTLIEFQRGDYRIVLEENFEYIQVYAAQSAPKFKIRQEIVNSINAICTKFFSTKCASTIEPDAFFMHECKCSTSKHITKVKYNTKDEPMLFCNDCNQEEPCTEDQIGWLEDLQSSGMCILRIVKAASADDCAEAYKKLACCQLSLCNRLSFKMRSRKWLRWL